MEVRMMLQFSWRITGMALRMMVAAVDLIMGMAIMGMALRMVAAVDPMGSVDLVHLRCNYCPFVQTSISEVSTALTGVTA
jgi:hypothetical protein